MHLQLSQYDGFGDGQRTSRSCLEDLYQFGLLRGGEERVRPPLEIEQTPQKSHVWSMTKKSMLTRSSLSFCSSSSSLRSAYCASTDPATSSKVVSSQSSGAYFDARKSSKGWRETAGLESGELLGVARDVFAFSFLFLLFLVERPLRYCP